MKRASRWLRSALFAAAIANLTGIAGAQDEAEAPAPLAERVVLRAGVLGADFRLDGHLGIDEWRAAEDSIANLLMVEPDEGEPPTVQTIVKVLADRDHVVLGVQCFDPEPQSIVSFSKARDAVLDNEDHVAVVFDTFLDSRSGYLFAVNPSGARFDGLISEEVNSDWDAVWEAKTARDARGWSVEIRIPVKSLYFERDLTTWGFNVQRNVPRLQEIDRWSGADLNFAIHQVSKAGILAALPRFDLGIGLSLRPSMVGRLRSVPQQPGPGIDSETTGDPSLDVTQRLGPNVQAALTFNTDFAETEVDVRQINLTRFPVFFPEKRSFFLQGADIFEFGAGLDEENMLPFQSRRIGLLGSDEEELAAIPINAGGKLNGRIGDTNFGILSVTTRKQRNLLLEEGGLRFDVPQTTMAAMRVSHNLLEESSVGVLATAGDQAGRDGSWSAGVDLTFQTSSFRGEKNFLAGAWGLLNDRNGLNGDKSAFGFRIDYPNDLLDINLTSIRIGDGFDPSLGFVPRRNVHIWDFGCEINPRPKWSWIRQSFHELSFTLFNRRNNSTWESYAATIKPFDWLLESGDRFDLGVEPEGDRPPEPFEVSADLDVAPGSYEWTRFYLGATSAERRRISASARYDFGDYYNGDLETFEGRIGFKPSALWAVELTGERSRGEVKVLPDDFEGPGTPVLVTRGFLEELYGLRALLNISSDLQFSSLTQYDIQSREIGTNNRLRWTFHPLGELFVVYNHNVHRVRTSPTGRRWLFVSNELPVKLQYALRF
jgi:hypothetical protein